MATQGSSDARTRYYILRWFPSFMDWFAGPSRTLSSRVVVDNSQFMQPLL